MRWEVEQRQSANARYESTILMIRFFFSVETRAKNVRDLPGVRTDVAAVLRPLPAGHARARSCSLFQKSPIAVSFRKRNNFDPARLNSRRRNDARRRLQQQSDRYLLELSLSLFLRAKVYRFEEALKTLRFTSHCRRRIARRDLSLSLSLCVRAYI